MYAGNAQRKYQKEYGDYIRSLPEDQVPCTYHNFADRIRYKNAKKAKEAKKSPKRLYDVQYTAYCQTTINPVPYAVFANRIKSKKYRSKKKLDAKFITPPPIEPTLVEKKKFQTPSRFDFLLLVVA